MNEWTEWNMQCNKTVAKHKSGYITDKLPVFQKLTSPHETSFGLLSTVNQFSWKLEADILGGNERVFSPYTTRSKQENSPVSIVAWHCFTLLPDASDGINVATPKKAPSPVWTRCSENEDHVRYYSASLKYDFDVKQNLIWFTDNSARVNFFGTYNKSE